MRNVDVAAETEVAWVENLVGARVVENRLGVDAGLVRERGEAGDVVIERHVHVNQAGHVVVDLAQQRQVVLGAHRLGVVRVHARDQPAQRRDAVALADPKHGGIDVRGTGLQRAEGVGDGAAGIVVAVKLDVAGDDAAQRLDQIENLARIGDAHRIGDTDTVDADLVHGTVDGEQVDQVAAEAVLGREAHFQPLALDELDHFDGRVDDVGNVLAVRELAQKATRAEDDVDAVGARVDGELGVVHVAAHVGEDLRREAERGDALQVGATLRAGGG